MRTHVGAIAAAAIGSLVACSSAPPPTPPPPVPVAPLPKAPPPAEPLAVSAPPPPIDVLALDTPAACEAETRTIYGRTKLNPLCDAKLERCFANFEPVQADDMRVQVQAGDPATALVTIPYEGLVLRGFMELRQVVLFPNRDLILGGAFVPDRVAPRAAVDGTLTVEAELPPSVSVEGSLRATVPCGDLLWASGWEPPADQDQRLGAQGPSELSRLLADAPVYAKPAFGKPVAELRIGGDPIFVNAYQRHGLYRFVTLWTDSGTAFGWLRNPNISRYNPMPSGHGSSAGGTTFVPLEEKRTGIRCPNDVPLLAAIDDALLGVGQAPARTLFTLGRELPSGLREVPLPHPRFTDGGDPPEIRTMKRVTLAEGVMLVVHRSSLTGCARARWE